MDIVPILFLTVVIPIALIGHYITKWKAMKQVTPKDERALGSMHTDAEKLEQRLEALERILDDEVPGWRRRNNDRL